MNRSELETKIIQNIHLLSDETLEKIFTFIHSESEKQNVKQRQLGILEGKAKCIIHDDFKITDEEFIQFGLNTIW